MQYYIYPRLRNLAERMLTFSQRSRRCRVACEHVLAMGRARAFFALRGAIRQCRIVQWNPHNVTRWEPWRDQMPASHELGDRNVRAGAAPGKMPVRSKKQCGTGRVQGVFVRLRSYVASPGSCFQALARLFTRP